MKTISPRNRVKAMRKQIKAILACDSKGGVSKDGTLPWPHNSMDLSWFKSNTSGAIIVMGSTTWKDPHMPRPLPNRKNVVVTTNQSENPNAHMYISNNLVESVLQLNEAYDQDVWIIGGPNIIEQTLGIIDKFYISRIPGDYNCDTFLPLKKIETLFFKDYEEEHPEVTFQIWKKGTV